MVKRLLPLLLLLAVPLKAQVLTNPNGVTLTPQTSASGNLTTVDTSTSCATANACVTIHLPINAVGLAVQLSGTFSATETFRESVNNQIAWVTQSTSSAVGITAFTLSGQTDFQVQTTAYTSGTVAVSISVTLNTGPAGPAGSITSNTVAYIGNAAKDNGTDYITGLLANGSTIQTARDVVGISNTSIWAPDGVAASPFQFAYDGLVGFGLGTSNTVLSNTATTVGMYSDGVKALTTSSAGQTVSVTNLVGFASNPPLFGGPGTMSATNVEGFWATNQGNAHVGTSYGVRVDLQSGSTTTNWGIFSNINNTDQTGNLFFNTIEAGGTAAVLAGTGACATITTQTGGASVGSFVCTGTTGAATVTITPGKTQAHGYNCASTQDITTRADLLEQTFFSTTQCQLTATTITSGDTFTFLAVGF